MSTFTTISKQRLSWPAPTTVAASEDYFLDIGSGFNLLIGSGYKLIIQPGDADTVWTPITKSQYS